MPKFAKALISYQDAEPPHRSAGVFSISTGRGILPRRARKPRRTARASDAQRVAARPRTIFGICPLCSIHAAYRRRRHQLSNCLSRHLSALIEPLDNRTSAIVTNELSFDKLFQATQDFQQDLDRIRGRNSISMSESQKLIRDYNDREIYRAFGANSAELIAEDDSHRYTIQKDVALPTPDDGSCLRADRASLRKDAATDAAAVHHLQRCGGGFSRTRAAPLPTTTRERGRLDSRQGLQPRPHRSL